MPPMVEMPDAPKVERPDAQACLAPSPISPSNGGPPQSSETYEPHDGAGVYEQGGNALERPRGSRQRSAIRRMISRIFGA